MLDTVILAEFIKLMEALNGEIIMCDYCNNEKSIISIEDTYEDGYTGIDRYENGDVYINGNELNLSCDVEVTYVSKSSKINYCPMCGRKLTEEN